MTLKENNTLKLIVVRPLPHGLISKHQMVSELPGGGVWAHKTYDKKRSYCNYDFYIC